MRFIDGSGFGGDFYLCAQAICRYYLFKRIIYVIFIVKPARSPRDGPQFSSRILILEQIKKILEVAEGSADKLDWCEISFFRLISEKSIYCPNIGFLDLLTTN